MGQQQAKPARAEQSAPSLQSPSLENPASTQPFTPTAAVQVDHFRSRVDYSQANSPPTGFSITRSFSKKAKARQTSGSSPATPADEYKHDMLRQFATASSSSSPTETIRKQLVFKASQSNLASVVPHRTSSLAAPAKLAQVDTAADASRSATAIHSPIERSSPITPSPKRNQRPPSSSGRSSSIKSSKRAEREWRARLAALSAGAVPRTSGEQMTMAGPVPPRRQVGRAQAATHAKLSSTPTPHPSMDFKRELAKATSFETLGAKARLAKELDRRSRPLSASTSKTFASLTSHTSITAPSDRFAHRPTTPHHLIIPPLTPDATPVPSPRAEMSDALVVPRAPSIEPSLSSTPSPMSSPKSTKFDDSLHTPPPQLRPLSYLSGLGFTFPHPTPRDTPTGLVDDDGEPILASRKREKMVGSRRSIPSLREASNDQLPPASSAAGGWKVLSKVSVAKSTPTKSIFSLDFISPHQSISSTYSTRTPESPTTAFILNAPSIDKYAWGPDSDLLGNGKRASYQTPPRGHRSRPAHPFAAVTATDFHDERETTSTSPSSASAGPQALPSPIGSSPPSAVAYGRGCDLYAFRAEPSSPTPRPRNERRRGGLDLNCHGTARPVLQPLNDTDVNRNQTQVTSEVKDRIPARRAFALTPGADGGHRPPKSGLPRPVSSRADLSERC